VGGYVESGAIGRDEAARQGTRHEQGQEIQPGDQEVVMLNQPTKKERALEIIKRRLLVELRRGLFEELDLLHFAGKLDPAGYQVEFTSLPPGQVGRCLPHERLIQINADIRSPSQIREVMLHEMVHGAVDLERPVSKKEGYHGKRFWLEMERLYLKGEVPEMPEQRSAEMKRRARVRAMNKVEKSRRRSNA
jgi:hypothetical protein